MQLPSPDTRTVGHAPYRVPAVAIARQPDVRVISRPSPISVGNGPALPGRRVTFASSVEIAHVTPSGSIGRARFHVSPVGEPIVRQAPPRY